MGRAARQAVTTNPQKSAEAIVVNALKLWGYEKRKEKLTYAIRGWVNYFRLAEMRNFLRETDEWLRSCVVAYACVYGNAGNECGHASRTCKDVASPNGRHGSGQIPEKAIGAPSIAPYLHVLYPMRT